MGAEQRSLSRLCSSCGMPDIDLFVSRLNHKVPKYASWKPDPLASFVDAFTLNRREFSNAYVFPSFCLVGRCLQKVILPQATLAVVVLLWCTKAWFTRLLSLLIDHPRFARVTKRVFHNPILGRMNPFNPKLYLLVCRIPGRGLLSETFRETLPKSSCGRGEKEHRNNMYLRKREEFCVQRQINSVHTSVYEVSCMISLLKVCHIRPSILHAQR